MQINITRLVLSIAALFFVFDIIGDINEGDSITHWLGESFIFLIICISLFNEIRKSKQLSEKVTKYEVELKSLKGNLAEVVKAQFDEWKLSKSESEVAWLIIKGFSLRSQAGTIYRKSNNNNRSEFTASFLDDILNQQMPS